MSLLSYSLKSTMDIMFGGKTVCVCGYGEVRMYKLKAVVVCLSK